MSAHENNFSQRDYSSISPSAKYVLLLKGLTDIPYARETAELISRPDVFEQDTNLRDIAFWGSVVHLDARYKSIDQLLWEIPENNILELSSGFSFRGLAATRKHNIHYIDTDLPELIERKQDLMMELPVEPLESKGKLEILAMNALDQQDFKIITTRFGSGPITIINEGLLMYLDMQEKEKLCQIVKDVLRERGGYWITADIYIKMKYDLPASVRRSEMNDFAEKMHIREKMFDSFEEAEAFFNKQGFIIDKEAEGEEKNSIALKYLMESATEEQINYFKTAKKTRATWRLKLSA